MMKALIFDISKYSTPLIDCLSPLTVTGMLLSGEFPVNYFSVSELYQYFKDFSLLDEKWSGKDGTKAPSALWKFSRAEDYGYKGNNEDPHALAAQFRI